MVYDFMVFNIEDEEHLIYTKEYILLRFYLEMDVNWNFHLNDHQMNFYLMIVHNGSYDHHRFASLLQLLK